MNLYTLFVVFSYTIVIAAIIGLIRFRKIIRTYRPFIYIVCVSFLSEVLSTVSSVYFNTNAVIVNIFIIIECYLWLWQFYCWDAFKRRPMHLLLLSFLLTFVWIVENIVMHKITEFSSAFRISYAFALVFLCVDQINLMIVNEKKSLLRSSKFLICLGITFFYSYKIMVEPFYLFHVDLSETFETYLYMIPVFINVFVNLIFGLAALWIPTRQRFTLPS